MSRFNRESVPRVGPTSAVRSAVGLNQNGAADTITYEGADAWSREPKSELFLLAASFMGGDSNFYERSDERYGRLLGLVRTVALDDPMWLKAMITWVRAEGNMRTVAMVMGIEAARFRVEELKAHGDPKTQTSQSTINRELVAAAFLRGDEPAEALAYWLSKYGKPIIQPVKNGIGDGARKLYGEYSYLKYGKSKSAVVGMRDVIRLTRPRPSSLEQAQLFEYIVREKPNAPIELKMLKSRELLKGIDKDARRDFMRTAVGQETLRAAGMTWEVLSEWIPGGMDAEAWEAAIPNMGIMALLRNLRNFSQAGISRESERHIEGLFLNSDVVRKSRQLPYRWYSAYRALDSVDNVRWANALDEALTYSVNNIPKLNGKSLVLIDMSGSMTWASMSDRSGISYADVAKLFGSAWALRNPHGTDLYQYGSGVDKVDVRTGSSVLKVMDKFHDMGGTQTHAAIAQTFRPEHKRVILITDEQAWSTSYDRLPVPPNVPVYVWNLAGYRGGVTPSGSHYRHTFGGLSDSAFKLIPILEAGRNAGWPWEAEDNGKTQETKND